MDPVVLAAGTALVSAMVTDGWQQARTAAVAWWRRARPGQAESVAADLDTGRARLLAARERGGEATEDATARSLVADWQLRLHELLDEDPALLDGLRALESRIRPAAGSFGVRVNARDSAKVFVSGRDMVVHDR